MVRFVRTFCGEGALTDTKLFQTLVVAFATPPVRGLAAFSGTVFGWAYFLDGVVAVTAGQLANWANTFWGPVGPFQLSAMFSIGAATLVLVTWTENFGKQRTDVNTRAAAKDEKRKLSDLDALPRGVWSKVGAAVQLIRSNPQIQKIVVSQTAFEGAMYMFVCVWVPVLKTAASAVDTEPQDLPFGAIFSCFMICCMLGSSVFALINELGGSNQRSFLAVLAIAAVMLGASGFFESGTSSDFSLPFVAPCMLSINGWSRRLFRVL